MLLPWKRIEINNSLKKLEINNENLIGSTNILIKGNKRKTKIWF